jgi:ABC-type Fe3+ transport system permease subunit
VKKYIYSELEGVYMTMLDVVLSVVALLILIIGLWYTLNIAKNTKNKTDGYDTEINENVQAHPYTRNPVFLAYIIGALVFFVFLAYYALSMRW